MTLRLTSRDMQIIKAVNDCRALQIHHIERLYFSSQSRAYDRVAKLVAHEYLDCLYVAQVSTSPVGSQRIFVTSQLGAQVLVDNFGYDISDCNFPNRQVKNWQSLKHILSISDVRVKISVDCRDISPIELLAWRDETYFRSKNIGVAIGSETKPLYPDGYCLIQFQSGQAHYFIEVDNGTEGHVQFRRQIEVYEAYVKSGQYQRDFQTSALRVLIVTTSQRRLKNLAESIRKVGGEELYLLTTFDELRQQTIFDGNVWKNVGYQPTKLV